MIYTKTGDSGTTSLVGGSRVDKDDVRVEAYGTVDELGSHIGLLCELLLPGDPQRLHLKKVQLDLFTLQTLLATETDDLYARLPQIEESHIATLEHWIDELTAELPKLHNFVVAGGNTAGAEAHVCRTVCRRAERRTVTLARTSRLDPLLQRYLNRLSDYLFVLARHAVVAAGQQEVLYVPEQK